MYGYLPRGEGQVFNTPFPLLTDFHCLGDAPYSSLNGGHVVMLHYEIVLSIRKIEYRLLDFRPHADVQRQHNETWAKGSGLC